MSARALVLVLAALGAAQAQEKRPDEKKPEAKSPTELVKARAQAFYKAIAFAKLRCPKAKKEEIHDCDACSMGLRTPLLDKQLSAILPPDLAKRPEVHPRRFMRELNEDYDSWRPGAARLYLRATAEDVEVHALRDRFAVYVRMVVQGSREAQPTPVDDVMMWFVEGDQVYLDPTWTRHGGKNFETPFFDESVSVAAFYAELVRLNREASSAGTTLAKDDATARQAAWEKSVLIADRGFVSDVQQAKDDKEQPVADVYWAVLNCGTTRVNVRCAGKREEFAGLKKGQGVLFRGKLIRCSFPDKEQREPFHVEWTVNLDGAVKLHQP